jgi:hypothetical protein
VYISEGRAVWNSVVRIVEGRAVQYKVQGNAVQCTHSIAWQGSAVQCNVRSLNVRRANVLLAITMPH